MFILSYLQRYKTAGQDTIILAGAEYGSGSSRDWAAKGPMLLVTIHDICYKYDTFNSLFDGLVISV